MLHICAYVCTYLDILYLVSHNSLADGTAPYGVMQLASFFGYASVIFKQSKCLNGAYAAAIVFLHVTSLNIYICTYLHLSIRSDDSYSFASAPA